MRADVDAQYQKEVVQWYAEPSTAIDGMGYPIGTMLFFTLPTPKFQ